METCDAYFVHILTYFIIYHNVLNMLYIPVTQRVWKMSISLNWTANHRFTVMLQTKHKSIQCILLVSRSVSILHTLLIKFKRRSSWYVNQRYSYWYTRSMWNGSVMLSIARTKNPYSPIQFHGINKTAELFIPLGRVRFWLWWLVVVCTICFSLHSHQVQFFANKKTKPVHAPHTIWYIYIYTQFNKRKLLSLRTTFLLRHELIRSIWYDLPFRVYELDVNQCV